MPKQTWLKCPFQSDQNQILDEHHKSETMNKIIELRNKYDLHMKVERYILEDNEYIKKQLYGGKKNGDTNSRQRTIRKLCRKIAELNDDVLFGEVWSREDKLSLRDRSLVTICVFMGKGNVKQWHGAKANFKERISYD